MYACCKQVSYCCMERTTMKQLCRAKLDSVVQVASS